MKPIQVRRTRHAGHCWRSRDELISDVLLWTPTYGRTKAGRRARTYIQQLCEDTGCSPEDLPEAMNDREKWRKRVRDIRAGGTTWWWWCKSAFYSIIYWYIYIYIYIYISLWNTMNRYLLTHTTYKQMLNICRRRWTIGKSGERGSGISVLPARHDDDDICKK